MSSPRTNILKAVRLRIANNYGPRTAHNWFRGVWRKPWQPGNKQRAACWVIDDGQRKAMSSGDAETEKQYVLSYKLIIDLKENWDRQKPFEDWTDHIQTMVVNLQNWLPPYCLIRNDYIADDPFDVVLSSGAVESVWMVEMEVEYATAVGNLGKS